MRHCLWFQLWYDRAMRTIAVEEHFVDPRIRAATQSSDWARRTRALGEKGLRLGTEVLPKLEDVGEARIAAMDAAGIDVQVLLHTQPGVEDLDGGEAVRLARDANDLLAESISRHPDRFCGLALVPDACAGRCCRRAGTRCQNAGPQGRAGQRADRRTLPRRPILLADLRAGRAPRRPGLSPSRAAAPAAPRRLFRGPAARCRPLAVGRGVGMARRHRSACAAARWRPACSTPSRRCR